MDTKNDKNKWTPNIHPLFIQVKEKASRYLLENGFSIFNTKEGLETFKNHSGVYISIVNQGYDFPEVLIGKNDNADKMIRFDYMLELFLTGKAELTIKHKSLNSFYDFEYEKDVMETLGESIMKINPFPRKYYDWIDSNDNIIENFSTK